MLLLLLTTNSTTTTTAHLLEELVLGGEMQNHLLVALLSLRARLRARDKNGNYQKERSLFRYLKSAGVLELLAIEIVGQQLSRLKVFFGGRSKVLELALGEVVLGRQVEP